MRKSLLIILFFLLASFVFLYFWTKNTPPSAQNSVQTTFQSFFPVGQETGEVIIPSTIVPEGGTVAENEGGTLPAIENQGNLNRNSALSHAPVAGFFISTQTGPTNESVEVVRYVNRENGFVYEIKGTAAPLQITNIQIPNIYEAYFTEGGKGVLLRFVKEDGRTIGTYYVPIPEPDPKTGVRMQKRGTFLRDNIFSLVVFADGKQIATLTDEKGESIVRISNPDSSKEQVFFKYPFKDWLLLASRLDLYLQTKAHSSFGGTLFQLSKNDYKKLITNAPGLTAGINQTGQYILSSRVNGTSLASALLNTKTGETKPTSKPVLPEKCVWTTDQTFICATPKEVPTAQYPEDWYLGFIRFSDDIAIINPIHGSTELKTVGGSFDMTQLAYSTITKALYFIDKTTGFLYKITL